ncbi:MAG TPA: N-acetyl-gamma-glutamyl-phosphate reductase, partial [Deltaproteobacteria bacterium]|nr:N-acetyl-gamma-glutamyl-phosphate reductase [Deltaproteobacteria bacterium]
EMEQELSALAGKPIKISFTPHLVPMTRGILSTVYANLNPGVSADTVTDVFKEFYEDAPFVRVLGDGVLPNTLYVRGTNFCDIGWKIDNRVNRIVVVSAIDNLTRGASGQAVCNMNLMFGLDETTGLLRTVWQP